MKTTKKRLARTVVLGMMIAPAALAQILHVEMRVEGMT
jgi:hypothetical protein